MSHFDLAAARAAALKALGRTGQKTLDALELGGVSVVLTAELPVDETGRRQLHNVTLHFSEDWREPWKLTVDWGGELLALKAHPEAVTGIREAVMLGRVMGQRIDVEVDDAAGLVLQAWAVDV